LNRRLVGHRNRLDDLEQRQIFPSAGIQIPDFPACSLVVILTELSETLYLKQNLPVLFKAILILMAYPCAENNEFSGHKRRQILGLLNSYDEAMERNPWIDPLYISLQVPPPATPVYSLSV
jgi:hypothetical protein